jgi:hypothetical protein
MLEEAEFGAVRREDERRVVGLVGAVGGVASAACTDSRYCFMGSLLL